jgi:hypothetical protein
MLNKKALFFLSKITLFYLAFLLFGCANRQPPQGGPKDHDPPKLLKATPPNMTRYFKAKIIQLDFDEFFKLNNTYTEVSMSLPLQNSRNTKQKEKALSSFLKTRWRKTQPM